MLYSINHRFNSSKCICNTENMRTGRQAVVIQIETQFKTVAQKNNNSTVHKIIQMNG